MTCGSDGDDGLFYCGGVVRCQDYIVQPQSSIECERGFSAQNIVKNKSRNRLSVARLELFMCLAFLR